MWRENQEEFFYGYYGKKKDVYALIGVEEYWIVSPFAKSIEIYVLKNGAYHLHAMYHKYDEREIRAIEEEKKYIRTEGIEIITEFSPLSFPDLIIKIDDIFDDLIEE
jgi:Uma2 family endonuclease